VSIAMVLSLWVPPAAAQAPAPSTQAAAEAPNELDVFMEKVLARREANRRTLEQYILDETEGFELLGPGRAPLYRSRREYTWYVRDVMHVRSPVRFNGVAIGEEARQKYEAGWIKTERERQERKARNEPETADVTIGSGGLQVGGAGGPVEPRFVSEAYFMEFKFEPGNYYLAGRETLEGHEVLRIEYYPTRLFGDEDKQKKDAGDAAQADRDARRRQRSKDTEKEIDRRLNKTALITLWVSPAEHQIVKYTFDNVWLDFLPGGWLVRVDDMHASMTMGQPFKEVWLPREMNVRASVTLASGSYGANYERTFANYRLAEVSTRIRVPKTSSNLPTVTLPGTVQQDPAMLETREEEAGTGPFVPGGFEQAAPEVIGEIRVHGNTFVTDKEVLEAAGLAVGARLSPDGLELAAQKLRDTRLFETVEVRKRYRSLSNTSDVAVVLLVHERPGVRSAVGIPGVPDAIARPAGRLRSKLMFLPIVSFADGYGFTYGGRTSTVDLLGIGERLSVPLTWGGTRRAALEFEREFERGPLTRVTSSVGIWNRENPRFDIRDQRFEIAGQAERVFADVVRLAVDASRSTVGFGTLDDRLWTIGATATLDTRLDPTYPGNAVLLTAAWTGLNVDSPLQVPDRVNRYTADARGYLRVFRQIVVGARARYVAADGALPPYERLLLGGSSSVRGFRTGAFDGDRTFETSIELRAPITSVLNGAKLGFNAFYDAGKAWDFGGRIDGADWHRGAGAGIFLIASIVRINVDVARGLKTGRTRLHVSSGFSF
jgi:hypothetical protein